MKELQFSQFQATVTGQVECAEPCPSATMGVQLLSIDGRETGVVVAPLEGDPVRALYN